jgi:hypothetical protein
MIDEQEIARQLQQEYQAQPEQVRMRGMMTGISGAIAVATIIVQPVYAIFIIPAWIAIVRSTRRQRALKANQ